MIRSMLNLFLVCLLVSKAPLHAHEQSLNPTEHQSNESATIKLETDSSHHTNRTNLRHHIENSTHSQHLRSSNTSHDTKHTRQCKPDDYKYGQWIPGATEHCGLLTSYALNDAKETRTQPYVYKGYNNWCWKPLHCKSEKFSAEAFCARLGSRKILMVGDSLQHLYYEALTSQLNPGAKTLKQEYNLGLVRNGQGIGSICNGSSRLVFIRNDQLRLKPDVREHMHDWTEFAPKYEIIILNKAAHYVPLDVSERDSKETAAFLSQLLHSHPQHVVYYRTASAGHPQATTRSVPDTQILDKEPLWLNCTTEEQIVEFTKNYHWDVFPAFNRLSLDIYQQHLGDTGRFFPLHVAEMTVLRPDGHPVNEDETGDRLHYLLPSVVDNWVMPLFNTLPPAVNITRTT